MAWQIKVHNRQALDLIKQVLRWLKSYKFQRAELIVKHYIRLTPRNGKYSQDLRDRRTEFVKQVLGIKANRANDWSSPIIGVGVFELPRSEPGFLFSSCL